MDLGCGHQPHPGVQDLVKELDTLRMKYDHLVVTRDAACSKFLANYVEWNNFKKWWNEFKAYDTVPRKIKAFNRVTKDGTLLVSKNVSQPPPSVLRMTGEFDPASDVDTAAAVETQHKAIRTALYNGRGILEGIVQPSPEVPTSVPLPITTGKAVKTPRSSQVPTDDDQTQDYTPPRPSAPRPAIGQLNLTPVPPPNFNPPETPIDPAEEEEDPFVRSLPSRSLVPSSRTFFSIRSPEQNDSVDCDSAAFEPIVKIEPTSPTRVLHSNVSTSRQASDPPFPDFPEMSSPSDFGRKGSSSFLGKRKLGSTTDITTAGSFETPKDPEMRRKRQKSNDIRTPRTESEQGPSTLEDPYAKYKGRGRYAQSAKKSVLLLGLKPSTNERTYAIIGPHQAM